jgi:hypothetical protein
MMDERNAVRGSERGYKRRGDDGRLRKTPRLVERRELG